MRDDRTGQPSERALAAMLIGACSALATYSLAWAPHVTVRTAAAAGAGVATGALLRRHMIALKTIATIVAIVWCTIAFTPLSRALLPGLVRDDGAPGQVDAIVVLSGGVTTDGALADEALDRVLSALALVRAGVSSTLVFTEVSATGHPEITGARDQMRLVSLLPAGVRVIMIGRIGTTRMEAVRVAAAIPPRSVNEIAVVTSPAHTRRACATFERVGFHVRCVAAFSRHVALRSLEIPSDRIDAFRDIVYERAALVSYHLHGWI